MLLGFRKRFVPFILDGTKRHTIRKDRAFLPKVGETCHCYTALRTKHCKLLGRWTCIKVQEIQIDWLESKCGMTLLITLDGVELDREEARWFAWSDGFRSRGVPGALDEMRAYWHDLHGADAFPFSGHVIHWKFKLE